MTTPRHIHRFLISVLRDRKRMVEEVNRHLGSLFSTALDTLRLRCEHEYEYLLCEQIVRFQKEPVEIEYISRLMLGKVVAAIFTHETLAPRRYAYNWVLLNVETGRAYWGVGNRTFEQSRNAVSTELWHMRRGESRVS